MNETKTDQERLQEWILERQELSSMPVEEQTYGIHARILKLSVKIFMLHRCNYFVQEIQPQLEAAGYIVKRLEDSHTFRIFELGRHIDYYVNKTAYMRMTPLNAKRKIKPGFTRIRGFGGPIQEKDLVAEVIIDEFKKRW